MRVLPVVSLLFVLLLQICANGRVVDTSFIANTTPGPYFIGDGFIDSASVAVHTDSTYLPPIIFIAQRNALLFGRSIDSGTLVHVHYTTRYDGLKKTQRLFLRETKSAEDTLAILPASSAGGYNENTEDLAIAGYKSVGVSVGNNGQFSIDQTLDVHITGEVAKQTRLEAVITDQGSTLDGATREISDLDQIALSISNPHYRAVLGDQYIRWPAGLLLTDEKKITGISASWSGRGATITAIGALAGSKRAAQVVRGVAGKQGPYYLTGNNERDFIMPVEGTVQVRVNGDKCTEGEQADYRVDYDLGAITFFPGRPVRSDDLIRVEYEYKTFNYLRSMVGTDLGYSTPDSAITVRGALWRQADNRDRPIDLTLTAADKRALGSAGDQPVVSSSARSVNPNDVAREDAIYPLYVIDSLGHFVYRAFDPSRPDLNRGFYYVWFDRTASYKGDYRAIIKTDYQGRPRTVYLWVGPGMGDYTPNTPLPRPEAAMVGEARVALRLPDRIVASVDIAGSDLDHNLFSAIDDFDNRGASVVSSLLLGKRDTRTRSLFIEGNHTIVTRNFTRQILSTFDHKRLFDDTTTTASEQQFWDATAGGTIFPGTALCGSYGQFWREDTLVTDRFSPDIVAMFFKRLSARFRADYFRHLSSDRRSNSRREELGLSLTSTPFDVAVNGFDEWNNATSGGGYGTAGVRSELTFQPLPVHESIQFGLHRRGNALVNAIDTAWTLLWDQRLGWTIRPGWSVDGTSSFCRNQTLLPTTNKNTTLLIDLRHAFENRDKDLLTSQHYATSQELAVSLVQRPVYRGKGLGTHTYIQKGDTLGEYVPSADGEYILETQEVYDAAGTPVRTSRLDAEWSFKPATQRHFKGLLADCSWKGALEVEEHIRSDTTSPGKSWVPGLLSLQGDSQSDLIRYSHLSYRQNVVWRTDLYPGWQVSLDVTPSTNLQSNYREGGVDWGAVIDRDRDLWLISIGARHQYFSRQSQGSIDTYAMHDIVGQLSQQYHLTPSIDCFVREALGWASKNGALLNEGWYMRLQPGATWHPVDKGWADLSYTFSNVNVGSDLDYRMAQGFLSGTTHVVAVNALFNLGSSFSLEASYRIESNKAPGAHQYDRPHQVLSVQFKAYLR